jgi:hypothetical protein
MSDRQDLGSALARSFEIARVCAKAGLSSLARMSAPYRTVEVTAGVVRTFASAAQIATGPAAALAIAAASEAAVHALASWAALESLGEADEEERRRALAFVIARIEDEALCDPMTADVWRFAVGAHDGALRSESMGGAARVVAGAAVAGVVRKKTLAKLLKFGSVIDLVHAPGRARRAHRLVARARHHARVFADACRVR